MDVINVAHEAAEPLSINSMYAKEKLKYSSVLSITIPKNYINCTHKYIFLLINDSILLIFSILYSQILNHEM